MKNLKINNIKTFKQKLKLERKSPFLKKFKTLALIMTIISTTTSLQGCKNKEIIIEKPSIDKPISEQQNKKRVAITFDDGPGKYTDRLLDILDENNAKATFFVLGQNVERYPNIIKRITNDDHEIGNHSYDHQSFTKDSIENIQNDLDLTNELIEQAGGETSNLTRPPYGAINENVQSNLDYAFIMWSVDTRDWESRNADTINKVVLENIKDGDILLFHDIHETTIDAIERLLPELSENYEFVTVTELYQTEKLDNNIKYYKFK